MRGGFALILGLAGYTSAVHALALTLQDGPVERAHALAPWDGRITATLSAKLSGPTVKLSERSVSDRVANLALRQDPTAVAAVATLGLNAQIRGDTLNARRLFSYSDSLSRRDLRTRLWAIEDAVARNDIPRVLRQYDIALRTSRFAPDLLFPILATAISDREVATALVHTLAAKPAWAEGFLAYLASTGEDPGAMAWLLTDLNRRGFTTSDDVNAAALERLVAGGSHAAAWAFYSQIRSNVDRARSRDPNFARLSPPTIFDWKPSDSESGISVSIQRGEQGGVVDFTAPPSTGGALLQQMQLLPPGRYLLEGRSSGIDQPPGSQPYWTLACLDGRETGRVDVPNSIVANGRFAGGFTVSAECPVQYLRLVARPSNLVSGLSGQIEEAMLRPAR